jgi:ribosomal protein L2
MRVTDKPVKSLTKGLHKSGGRNNRGRMTLRIAVAATKENIGNRF